MTKYIKSLNFFNSNNIAPQRTDSKCILGMHAEVILDSHHFSLRNRHQYSSLFSVDYNFRDFFCQNNASRDEDELNNSRTDPGKRVQ